MRVNDFTCTDIKQYEFTELPIVSGNIYCGKREKDWSYMNAALPKKHTE